MGRGRGTFKLILIIFIFYLAVQGSSATALDNGEAGSNNASPEAIEGTITGTITGTINSSTDNTVDTGSGSRLNNEKDYEWILLLPIFYGNLLFLSWISRFFDKMNFCFVLFVLTALLVIVIFSLLYSQADLIETNNSSNFTFYSQVIREIGDDSSIFSDFFLIISIIVSIIISLIIITVLYSALFKKRDDESNLKINKDKVTVNKDNVVIDKNRVKIDENRVKIDKKDFIRYKTRVLIDENELIVNLHDIVRNFLIIFLGLMWPTMLLYFHLKHIDYVTFYGIDDLEFPVYIIVASSIGILSYLFLSIEDVFCQLIPEYKRISIAWSYLRRITIAPFISLIGFYLLNQLRNTGDVTDLNHYSIFLFSFFAGVFTKTIEEWIYAWVQKLLPGDKKSEFEARTEYQIKESELVKKLRFDEDLVYALYNAKVRSIEELAASEPENLKNRLNFDSRNLGEHMGLLLTEQKERFDSYSKQQVKMYIDRAQTYMNIGRSEFITKLNMDRDLAFKLYYFAGIKTLEDLKNCNPANVFEKICDRKKEAEELVESKKIKITEAYKELCGYSEEDIKKLKKKADCICYFASIKTLEDLKNCDPAEVFEKIYECKKEAEELAKSKNIDIKELYKILCGGSEEDIKKFSKKIEDLSGEKTETEKQDSRPGSGDTTKDVM